MKKMTYEENLVNADKQRPVSQELPNTIFVILDPTEMVQPSLMLAESIAADFNAQRPTAATLHVYCCINETSLRSDSKESTAKIRDEALELTRDWVARLVEPTRALGLKVETEVEIAPKWRKAIAAAVARQHCALAIKTMSQHSRLMRAFHDSSDWKLLRDSSCPVYLVKTSPKRHVRKVVAAIKHRTEKKVYTEANDLILATARGIAGGLGAELHVVTAYKDVLHYPDRQKFADRCGVERNRVRAEMGSPQEAVAAAATEIGADLVVMARVGKPGSKRDVGHTAEKIIDALDTDLLILPMTETG
jgi:universal stress protein E